MKVSNVPWFVSASAVVATVAGFALALNYLLADYFVRTYIDEADPLAAVAANTPASPPSSVANTPIPSPSAVASAIPAGMPPEATATVPGAPANSASETPAPSQPTAVPPTAVPTMPPPAPGILAEGPFRDGEPGHTGSGTARIIRAADGKLFLRLENFSVTNGPDLRVYLTSSDGYDGERLDLGKLKATDGNQNYELPPGTDVNAFRSALIWCEPFRVLFAIATLEETP